jgi:hypothetical protein
MEKDNKDILKHKTQTINEIKKIDKSEMFKPKPKEKISLLKKIGMILGYGKKR